MLRGWLIHWLLSGVGLLIVANILPGIAVEVVPPPDITVRFDMELHLWPQDGGFVGFFAYNRDLFERATIEAWINPNPDPNCTFPELPGCAAPAPE